MFDLGRFFRAKETDSSRFERLEAKIRELADDLADVKRRDKQIHLEWDEVYDKVHHLMARVTKRQKALDKDQELFAARQDDPGASNGNPPRGEPTLTLGTHGRLQEMRRRNGLLPRG